MCTRLALEQAVFCEDDDDDNDSDSMTVDDGVSYPIYVSFIVTLTISLTLQEYTF